MLVFEKLSAARTVIFIHFVEGLCTSGPADVSTKSNPAFVIFQLELMIGKHTCQFSDHRQWCATLRAGQDRHVFDIVARLAVRTCDGGVMGTLGTAPVSG